MSPVIETRSPRIVMTGGPGGGKTTAADLFRREIGASVVVVPEAATMLYGAGFPRFAASATAAQRAIFHVQRNLEAAQSALFPDRILICDRGTIDGAVYWPGPCEDFFAAVGTTFADELARYDAVLFFETGAAGGVHATSSPVRIESIDEAVALDRSLQAIWSQHPRYHFLPHDPSFVKKVLRGLEALERVTTELGSAEPIRGHRPTRKE